jgi:predicted O-methyltransferase YrrM
VQMASFARKVVSLLKRVPIFADAYRTLRLSYTYRTLRLFYMLRRTGSGPFVYWADPGHYYSAIPNMKELLASSQMLAEQSRSESSGIDLREEAQLTLLDAFSRYYSDSPFVEMPDKPMRYYYPNGWFECGDAVILYCVLRHYEPRRVIEIGSGFSSAALLDVNELFLRNDVQMTFIEPNPERLLSLLTQGGETRHNILRDRVQNVPLELFQTLSANDILLVDSSHVVKAGSDVGYILFNILPALKPGVVVHFHDVFWPFEYPQKWILQGRAWNEAYFLRSFLQYNAIFEVIYFNSFMVNHHAKLVRERMPLCLWEPGSSLWLRKVA